MKFSIALLQILPDGNNQGRNLEKGIEYCARAKRLGADLALLPELWNIGFAPCPGEDEGRRDWEESAIDQRSDFFQGFVRTAQQLELHVALPYLEKYDPKPRNTVSVIDKRGNPVLNYSKVFLCDFEEDRQAGCDSNCTPGNSFEVCALTGSEGTIRLGAMICADREFPEAATQLMLKGAELIVVPNSCLLDGIRSTLLKARAFENLVGIAAANYPPPPGDGNSQAYTCVAWNENGSERETLLVRAGQEEGVFLALFDVDEIREFRKREDWRMNYIRNRRPVSYT